MTPRQLLRLLLSAALCWSYTSLADSADLPPVAAFRDTEKTKQWGFIDRGGRVVIGPKYDWATDFVDGLAMVFDAGRTGFIDTSGRLKFHLPSDADWRLRARGPKEGKVWYGNRDGKWGLLDGEGRKILPPTYDDVREFSEGLAEVNTGARIDGKRRRFGRPEGGEWGYVDSKGTLVIGTRYKYVRPFSDGLASVRDDAGAKYIDRAGKVVITLENGSAGDFRDGLAPVRYSVPGPEAWRTGYIDKQGHTIFMVDGYAEEFSEGLAAVALRTGKASDEKRYGYIDQCGKMAIPPRFAEAQTFKEGLAAVRIYKANSDEKDGTWGYIDKAGTFVIDPAFSVASSFKNGIASVYLGGKRRAPLDGFVEWRDGASWLINGRGKKLARCD